jgi:hypothetical protein
MKGSKLEPREAVKEGKMSAYMDIARKGGTVQHHRTLQPRRS